MDLQPANITGQNTSESNYQGIKINYLFKNKQNEYIT